MREEVNPKNDQGLFGHDHKNIYSESIVPEVESEDGSEGVIIPFPSPAIEEVKVENKEKWHTPVAFGLFGGIFGGVMALPTIEMIESENGFNTEVPGNIGASVLVVAGVMFVSTAVYKHFKP